MAKTNPYEMSPDEKNLATMDNAAATLAGLERQYQAAQQGVGKVQEEREGALGDIRAKSGQSFAQDMNRGGGGSLARMRQNNLSRGVAEGTARGYFADLEQDATMQAAKAQTDLATEKQKLNKAAQAEDQKAGGTYDAIKAYFIDSMEGNLFTTDADRAVAIANIRAQWGNDPNPEVRAQMEKAIKDIEAGTIESSGYDTAGVKWYNPLSWFG